MSRQSYNKFIHSNLGLDIRDKRLTTACPYLDHKLQCAGGIGIAADNNDNIHVADAHVKERTASYLPHWACTQILRLHYVGSESIHHVAPASMSHNNKMRNPSKTLS
jgi:hypothetical protein